MDIKQGPLTSSANQTIDIRQKMAEFIVNAEMLHQHPLTTKSEQLLKLPEKEQKINQQISEVKNELAYFRQVMTRAGAMQWRHETEKLVNANKTEISHLQEIYSDMHASLNKQCEKLNRASMNTIKTMSQVINSSRKHDMKKMTMEKSGHLQEACATNLQSIDRIVQNFHWRNLFLTVLLTLIVSFIVSLYIDDQWPWQAHAQIEKEREAGQILLNSWPQLSHNDQNEIIANA